MVSTSTMDTTAPRRDGGLYTSVEVVMVSRVVTPVVVWSLIGILLLGSLYCGWTFNRLVGLRNRLREAWSGVEVQLKRRHDLVPGLVECVKAYRRHEQTVLESLSRNRGAAQAAQGVADAGSAENQLTRDLRTLIALAEAYPDLKADGNFRQLSSSLVEIEDDLQYARRYYNGTVRDLNNLIQSFPSLIVAGLFGFRLMEFFEVETVTERLAPEVKL